MRCMHEPVLSASRVLFAGSVRAACALWSSEPGPVPAYRQTRQPPRAAKRTDILVYLLGIRL